MNAAVNTATGLELLRLRRRGFYGVTHMVKHDGEMIGYLSASKTIAGEPLWQAIGAVYNLALKGWLPDPEIFHQCFLGTPGKLNAIVALVKHHATAGKHTTIN